MMQQQQHSMFTNCGAPWDFLGCAEEGLIDLMNGWFTTGLEAAQYMFIALATLELVVSGYMLVKKEGMVNEVLKLLIAKLLFFAFIYLLLEFSTQNAYLGGSLADLPLLWSEDVANRVTGNTEVLNFTALFKKGLGLWNAVMQASFMVTPFNLLNFDPMLLVNFLLGLIAAGVLLGVMVRLALQLLFATLECYFVMSGGAVLLGFLSFRATAPLGEGYFRYMTEVAVKLFFLNLLAILLIQIGDSLLAARASEGGGQVFLWFTPDAWGVDENGNSIFNPTNALLILLALGWFMHQLIPLPAKLAGKITGGMSFNVKALLEKI